MSGGEPPLPPSRPPYHPWHGRPPHRRRVPNPSNPPPRTPWLPRRSRSPPAFRPRRAPPYKHHRHPAQSPPAASPPQPLTSFHPHGAHHGPPLPRSLQGRLRSPPRSPPRRGDQHPYRNDHTLSHRLDHFDHPSFRGLDHISTRAPLSKSRTEPSPFRSDHRPLSDHHSYRTDHSPTFRTDMSAHRDDYDTRRGDTSGIRTDSQFAQRIRPLHGNIHKPRKPRPRRPLPHLGAPLRSSQSHLLSPDSHLYSRVGERPVDSFRIDGRPSTSPSNERRSRTSPVLSSRPPIPDSSKYEPSAQHAPPSSAPPSRALSASRPISASRPVSASRSLSSSRPLLVQPPTPPPKPVSSSSLNRPQLNGVVRGTAPPPATPPKEPFVRGADNKRREPESVKDANPNKKCNGAVSPVANGVVEQKSSSEPEGRGAAQVDRAKKKEKLGLKLGSLGLALTSQALAKNQSSASLEKQRELPPKPKLSVAKTSLGKVERRVFTPKSQTEPVPPLPKKSIIPSSPSKSLKSLLKPVSEGPPREKLEEKTTSEHRSRESDSGGIEKSVAPPSNKEDLRRSLGARAPASAIAQDVEMKDDISAKGSKHAGTSKPENVSVSLAIPPLSVPAPALTLMQSPRLRKRPSVNEKLTSINSLIKTAQSVSLPVPPKPFVGTSSPSPSSVLTSQIHQVEARIISLERELSNARSEIAKAKQLNIAPKKKKLRPKEGARTGSEAQREQCEALAKEVLEREERRQVPKRPKPSPVPIHNAFRRLLTQNRAKAAAANAEFRHVCSDSELGLVPCDSMSDVSQVSEEVLRKVAQELKRRRHAALERRRKLAREYAASREAWARRLRSARDKRSKEKREAIRERDRFLLLSTKGSSALLTQRTSSGRTSTKLFPSISPNGQTNGTAGLDAQLAEIEAAGGTPGFNAIWSKTLAQVPDQDLTRTPIPCTSVLVEDPLADFLGSRAINPWRYEEKLIFLEKYLAYPKNFRKISSFLNHKSSRDCSYFYYTNKLHLGLKQLTKEYQSLKRKGILRQHLTNVAYRHTTNTVPVYSQKQITKEEVDAILSGAGASSDDLGLDDGNANSHPWFADLSVVVMKRSERILVDFGLIDLSGIDRRAFAHALSIHGHDWKGISMQMRLEGKTSTHYREFFRQNRRNLESEALLLQRSEKLPSSMRRSQGARQISARMSPRSSPRASPKPSSNSQSEKFKVLFGSVGLSLPNGPVLSKSGRRRVTNTLELEGKKSSLQKDQGRNEKETKKGRSTNS